jgi:predicted nuclease of predicted toxin-antitoxin system
VLKLVADENFRREILRGLLAREPSLDAVRVQDVGLRQADDPTILAWAATEGRVLLTHDARTMIGYAYARVRAGQPMPGVIEVPRNIPTGRAIDELLLVVLGTLEGEMEGQVRYLPL